MPGVLLAVNWKQRESLARRHALFACLMWCVVIVLYAPVTVWAFAFGGPRAVFWAVYVVAVAGTLCLSTVGLVLALRAPIVPSARLLPPPPPRRATGMA